ncbi:MAG: NAD/NADP octopine/nopaline dehydrogenase family protein [Hungatella sp.]
MKDKCMKNITVIGTGRTARAMVAYLGKQGRAVTIYGRNKQVLEDFADHGIEVTGFCQGHYYPQVEVQMKDAVKDAEIILVMTVASAHRSIAQQLAGNLQNGQCILIFNGNWGACEFYQILQKELEEKQVIVAETGSMLFLADYIGDKCHIKSVKKELAVAAIPAYAVWDIVKKMKFLFPQLVPQSNVVETSFNNSNPIIHAPLTLFNITRMEQGEDYYFYGEGATRSTIGFVERIDEERCAVMHAMGIKPQRCVDIINSFWPEKYEGLYDAIKNNKLYLSGKGPTTLNHRYLTEDLPFGIVPIALLGKEYKVSTPCVDNLLKCFEYLLNHDYQEDAPLINRKFLQQILTMGNIYDNPQEHESIFCKP